MVVFLVTTKIHIPYILLPALHASTSGTRKRSLIEIEIAIPKNAARLPCFAICQLHRNLSWQYTNLTISSATLCSYPLISNRPYVCQVSNNVRPTHNFSLQCPESSYETWEDLVVDISPILLSVVFLPTEHI